MVSLRGLGRWQRWSKPVAPVTLLVAPKQCPDPTTTEQNKIWGWTNSCRISGSFIQIAHFPCFFLSLSPPPLDPRGRPHSQFKEERGRDKQTNRGRDWVANMEELWHSWKGERERERERERNSCIESDYEREAVAKSGSPLSVWLTLDGNVLLHSFSPGLPSSDLLLTPCCLTIDPLGFSVFMWLCVSGWSERGWWWWWWWRRRRRRRRGVQDGGLRTPHDPPPPPSLPPSTSPPPIPVLHSEPRLSGAGGAESGGRTEGEILLICVEFYYFQLFGSWWLPLSFPPSSSFLPCHANTGFPRTASSVCVLLCFLPFPVLPHPCLSRQLTFLTSATFLPVCSLLLCLSHFSPPHRAGWHIRIIIAVQFIPLVFLCCMQGCFPVGQSTGNTVFLNVIPSKHTSEDKGSRQCSHLWNLKLYFSQQKGHPLIVFYYYISEHPTRSFKG